MESSRESTPPWQWNIPAHFNIGDACTRHGRDSEYANTLALIVDYGDGRVEQLSYAQLAADSDRFASAIGALGLDPGQRLLIRLPNSIHYPIAFFGSLQAGAIAVPASTQLTAEEVAYIGADAGASILLTTASDLPGLRPMIAALPLLRHIIVTECPGDAMLATDLKNQRGASIAVHRWEPLLEQAQSLVKPYRSRADDPAYLVYTSGSTGYPKGVLHAHRALLGRQPSSEYWFNFTGDDRILHSGKLNWTYALGTAMMDPFYRGKTVVLNEGRVSAQRWPQLIAQHHCTIFIGVPTVYRQILQKTAVTANDVPSLRYCMSAGEHLSDEILVQWRQRFGQDIYEAVGMSEFSYYLSHHPSRPLRAGSAGKPQPGHDVALLDPAMQAVADTVEGMLCIPEDDPGLFLKYWGLPEETAALRRDGFFLTGDYAVRDSDGYIWFRGRKDDIINSMGYRISPFEIERVLKGMPGVADCVAIDEAVASGAVIVTACIIAEPSTRLQVEAVIAFAGEHLAAYKVPKKVRFMASFPRTANGKVLRKGLRAQLAESL
jgi:acyl-coenzyme A synthetase/AMP-(fatty) acid ligase